MPLEACFISLKNRSLGYEAAERQLLSERDIGFMSAKAPSGHHLVQHVRVVSAVGELDLAFAEPGHNVGGTASVVRLTLGDIQDDQQAAYDGDIQMLDATSLRVHQNGGHVAKRGPVPS